MVTMRRRNSEASLGKAPLKAAVAADFITQAPRTRAAVSAEANTTNNKRTRTMMEEHQNNCAANEVGNETAKLNHGLETPVIRSSGLAPTSNNGLSSENTTVSTDDSMGTSESLEEEQELERLPKHNQAVPTAAPLPSSSNQSICCSESSEVCVSLDASGKEVVSCRRMHVTTTTTMQAVDDDTSDEDLDDNELDEFDPYSFIKTLPPLSKCVQPRNTFLLPRLTRHSHKKTLVLDLDETLVHSTLDGASEHSDFVFPVSLGSVTHMVSVRQRPHLHTFLARMARHFEIVVFTASQQIYAEQLLDIVDPNGEYIRHRIYRDSCVVWEGNYLKDLTVLGRDLAHTIIVDNSPQAFGFQLENGVPIKGWYDDAEDMELLRLLPFLEELAHVDDVRPHLGDKYGLKDLVASRPYPSYY